MSIENYISKFLTLTNRLSSLSEVEKIFYFKEGLKDDTKRELICRGVKELEKAIPLASQSQLESSRNGLEKVIFLKTTKAFSNHKNPKYKNKNFNNSNSINSNYQKDENKNISNQNKKLNYIKKDIICNRCKKKGHYANKCRVILNKINSIKVVRYSDIDKAEKIYVLSSTEQKQKGIPSTIGFVNGVPLKIGIDCGATQSVMNHMTAIRYNFEILSTHTKVKTATGCLSSASGKTKPLEIDIGGEKSILEFIVFDHDDHDILLGLDWFKSTNAGIFPSQGIIKFQNYDYQLNDVLGKDLAKSETDIFEVFLSELEESDNDDDYFWENCDFEMVPESELNSKEFEYFKELKKDASTMFPDSIENLGACSVYEHSIRLKDEDMAPIFTPPYRKSEAERNFLKEEITLMLKANIIRRSRSPWSSPVIVVPKKDGSYRICIDYRKLNQVTISEKWPLPNILDILNRLKNSVWFSVIDLKSGYW